MPSITFAALAGGVAAVALTAGLFGSGQAGAAPTSSTSARGGSCFSNLGGDTDYAVPSQNFEAAYEQYDSIAADNFTLSEPCVVDHLRVRGRYFRGTGPAESVTVAFYADDGKGVPGTVLDRERVGGLDDDGSLRRLPITPLKLDSGSYWVSVVANLDFAAGGQWGWEVTTTKRGDVGAQWQNPGDGFGSGCTTWGSIRKCAGAEGPDLMFSVSQSHPAH